MIYYDQCNSHFWLFESVFFMTWESYPRNLTCLLVPHGYDGLVGMTSRIWFILWLLDWLQHKASLLNHHIHALGTYRLLFYTCLFVKWEIFISLGQLMTYPCQSEKWLLLGRAGRTHILLSALLTRNPGFRVETESGTRVGELPRNNNIITSNSTCVRVEFTCYLVVHVGRRLTGCHARSCVDRCHS